MRYYEVYLPGAREPLFTTNARRLRNLPDGTRVVAVITDRDGTLIDSQDLPVKDGRVVFGRGRGSSQSVHSAKVWYGR